MTTTTIVHLRIDPNDYEEFMAHVREMLPHSRAFPGNRGFEVLVDHDDAGHVMFVERWERREAHEQHRVWIREVGGLDAIGKLLRAAPEITYFKTVER